MPFRISARWRPAALTLIVLASGLGVAWSQWGWWNRFPPRFPAADRPADRLFSFCRILYERVRYEPLGHGWNTDYPSSDVNLTIRLSQLTTTAISWEGEGEPNHVVLPLTDERLFDYPFIFVSDAGTVGFNDLEVARLRDYLLKGGFLWADDFWGEAAWEHWSRQMAEVLPPAQYPIRELPSSHIVFRLLYDVPEVPQIPSIQFWRRSGGGTSERGAESADPSYRVIEDEKGRMMVVMTHNTDIADGWEREGENEEFFYRFSVRAYPVGINTLLYAMTH